MVEYDDIFCFSYRSVVVTQMRTKGEFPEWHYSVKGVVFKSMRELNNYLDKPKRGYRDRSK